MATTLTLADSLGWPKHLVSQSYMVDPLVPDGHGSSNQYFESTRGISDKQAIEDENDRLRDTLRTLLADRTRALVVNTDAEEDDRAALEVLLTKWGALEPSERCSVVIVVGQNYYHPADEMFERMSRFVSASPEQRRLPTHPTTGAALEGKPTTQESDAAVARQVESVLRSDTRYIWSYLTTLNLFDHILPEVKEQCDALIQTCATIPSVEQVFTGANLFFDSKAAETAAAACKKLGVPYLDTHGAASRAKERSLASVVGWSDQLGWKTHDPKSMRQAAMFSESLSLTWLARIDSHLKGMSPDETVAHLKSLLIEAGADLDPKSDVLEAQQARQWYESALRQNRYDVNTNGEIIDKRTTEIRDNALWGLNNTAGDLATLLPLLSPDDFSFLPFKTGKEAIVDVDGNTAVTSKTRTTIQPSLDITHRLLVVPRDPDAPELSFSDFLHGQDFGRGCSNWFGKATMQGAVEGSDIIWDDQTLRGVAVARMVQLALLESILTSRGVKFGGHENDAQELSVPDRNLRAAYRNMTTGPLAMRIK